MKPRLTFVINHAAFFVSHRLPIALHARERGYRISLVTGQAGSAGMELDAERRLAAEGIDHRRVAFGASSMNPLVELSGLAQLIASLRWLRPDIVHCASPKGILYGGLAARLTRVPALVLAVSGMGYAFTQGSGRSLARRAISTLYRRAARIAFAHPNRRFIVQNRIDRQFLLDSRLAGDGDIELIAGSGVSLDDFAGMGPQAKQRLVLLPARMLVDKGVREIVEAARRIRADAAGWRFVLAGAADYRSPSAIPPAEIRAWQAEGVVEWLGHVDDMLPLYRDAAIVCLPSYREGMPKVLLEAAAAGCATVTTDVPGCCEAIADGVTGDLVPVRDSSALADTLLALIKDDDRRRRYGSAGRLMARQRFSIESVKDRTMEIYAALLEKVRDRTGP